MPPNRDHRSVGGLMANRTGALAQSAHMNVSRIITWFIWAACLSIILAILASLVMQFVVPPPPSRLVLINDIPLPGALPDMYRTRTRPLAPGVAVPFDHFDFQALTHTTPSFSIAQA